MKTVELSAALGQAQVVENLKNFVGVDAQGAAALMTPERLAAVAGGLLNKSNSFLNELAQDIFGQSIITHKPYNFDANDIRGTVLCLCNGNTKNIPTSEFGFFLQIQIPYEDVSDYFRLQLVFESKMSGDIMGNMYWRIIWNDEPKLWNTCIPQV